MKWIDEGIEPGDFKPETEHDVPDEGAISFNGNRTSVKKNPESRNSSEDSRSKKKSKKGYPDPLQMYRYYSPNFEDQFNFNDLASMPRRSKGQTIAVPSNRSSKLSRLYALFIANSKIPDVEEIIGHVEAGMSNLTYCKIELAIEELEEAMEMLRASQ